MDFKKTVLAVMLGLFVYDLGDAVIMRLIKKYRTRIPAYQKAMEARWTMKQENDKKKMRKIGFGEN